MKLAPLPSATDTEVKQEEIVEAQALANANLIEIDEDGHMIRINPAQHLMTENTGQAR